MSGKSPTGATSPTNCRQADVVARDDSSRTIFNQDLLEKFPLVSINVLTYNHSLYLKSALDGILCQDVDFPFEVLIGEDNSTDGTLEIALEYQRNHPQLFKIITSDCNVGIRRNWQRLVSASRGKFIAHLDGDDFWLPGKLAPQIRFLLSNPDCAAVYTGAITVNEAGIKIGRFNNVGTGRFDLPAMVRRGNFLNTSTMLYRSGYREELLEPNELFIDYQAHLRLARHGFLVQLDQQNAAYRVNATGSLTADSNDLVRKLYWEALMDVPRDSISGFDLTLGMADFLRRVASRSIRERRPKLLMYWAPQVFRASPWGAIATAALAFCSAAHAAALLGVSWMKTPNSKNEGVVLHRR